LFCANNLLFLRQQHLGPFPFKRETASHFHSPFVEKFQVLWFALIITALIVSSLAGQAVFGVF